MGNAFGGDEGVTFFEGGSMYIELFENIKSFIAGQQVTGTVHMDLKETFDSTSLTIELHGREKVSFYKRHVSTTRRGGKKRRKVKYKWHYGEAMIIKHSISLQDFIDGPPRPGQWSYPFTLTLPDWLPASMLLGSRHERSQLGIHYSLRAQMTPSSDDGWAYKDRGISKLTSNE